MIEPLIKKKFIHPCQTCGACCASYRVAFYWLAAAPETENAIPLNFVEDLDESYRCMKGTNSKHHPSCCALKGRVGQFVSCDIYTSRPQPCRSFQASFENGQANSRCDEARAKHGLSPLTLKNWVF